MFVDDEKVTFVNLPICVTGCSSRLPQGFRFCHLLCVAPILLSQCPLPAIREEDNFYHFLLRPKKGDKGQQNKVAMLQIQHFVNVHQPCDHPLRF